MLADEFAGLVVGGLSVLERLLRNLDEEFPPDSATGSGQPQVLVLWRSAELLQRVPALGGRRPLRLEVRDVLDGTTLTPGAATPEQATLLLRTNVVLGRGVLTRLLRRLTRPDPEGDSAGDVVDRPVLTEPVAFPLALLPRSLAPLAGRQLQWNVLERAISLEDDLRVEPADGFCAVVRGPEDLPAVERALCRSLTKATDGYVARTVNRPISTRLTRLLAGSRVTPNQVSLAVLAIILAGSWSLIQGTPWGFLVGTVLFHLASVVDGCDGEIARLKFLESPRGAWLDTSVDHLGNQLFVLCLGIGLARQPGLARDQRLFYLWEAGLTMVGIVWSLSAVALYTRRTSGDRHFNRFGITFVRGILGPGRLRSLLHAIGQLSRRDSMAVICFVLALVGRPDWILHGLAFVVAAHVPFLAWWLLKSLAVSAHARTE